MKKFCMIAFVFILTAGLFTGCRRNVPEGTTVPSTATVPTTRATVPPTTPATRPTTQPTMPSTADTIPGTDSTAGTNDGGMDDTVGTETTDAALGRSRSAAKK